MTPKPGEAVDLKISDAEAALYDRQIRLWGVDSQKKLRRSNVLVIGLTGLASEIVKNIVLAGINSLVVIDHEKVSHGDSLGNLFTQHAIGQNRALASQDNIQLLNPNVSVSCKDMNIRSIIDDSQQMENLLKDIHVVILNNSFKETAVKLNKLTRSLHKLFYFTGSFGFFGFAFNDFGEEFKFTIEVKKEVEDAEDEQSQEDPEIIPILNEEEGSSPPKKLRTNSKTNKEIKTYFESKTFDYIPLESALEVKAGKSGSGLTKRTSPVLLLTHILLDFFDEHGFYPRNADDISLLEETAKKVSERLRLPDSLLEKLNSFDFCKHVYGEYSPVCSIVGGVIGQDVIRGVTNKETPIRNFFLFNAVDCNGVVESVGRFTY